MAVATDQKIAASYIGFFSRSPDQEFLSFWKSLVPAVGSTQASGLKIF